MRPLVLRFARSAEQAPARRDAPRRLVQAAPAGRARMTPRTADRLLFRAGPTGTGAPKLLCHARALRFAPASRRPDRRLLLRQPGSSPRIAKVRAQRQRDAARLSIAIELVIRPSSPHRGMVAAASLPGLNSGRVATAVDCNAAPTSKAPTRCGFGATYRTRTGQRPVRHAHPGIGSADRGPRSASSGVSKPGECWWEQHRTGQAAGT